jgi:hypothetical protein
VCVWNKDRTRSSELEWMRARHAERVRCNRKATKKKQGLRRSTPFIFTTERQFDIIIPSERLVRHW